MKKFATVVVGGRLLELDAPGLKIRPRKNGTIYVKWEAPAWAPHFLPRSVRFEPDWNSPSDFERIAAECRSLQGRAQAQASVEAGVPAGHPEPGTLGELIELYRSDSDSPIHGLRASTRETYGRWMELLTPFGAVPLNRIDLEGLRGWFVDLGLSSHGEEQRRSRRASAAFQMLRLLFSYGATRDMAHCDRIERLVRLREFDPAVARRLPMTEEHARQFVDYALAAGEERLALAQACQFELGLSQLQVIGEWLDVDSDYAPLGGEIVFQRRRWTGGLTFAMLDQSWLRIPRPGGDIVFDLTRHPLILRCIERIESREGPIVVRKDGRPYDRFTFARAWRALATRAGIPADVWNSDSSRLTI